MSTPPGSGDSPAWQAALALTEELLELPEGERDAALSQSGASPEALALARLMLAAAPTDSVLDTPLPSLLDEGEDPADTLVGRRLGRWLLTGLLGQGGMSVVYRARSLSAPVGQEAALKLLSLAAATPEGRARFEREIDILVRLRHPGIAPVFDAGVADDGTPWFAMALVEGQDIATWCREQGLDVAARVDLMLQVCDAVEHAHRHLVIHRDIKPSNVLVDGEGRAILLDFGISRMLEDGATEITTAGTYAFTPRYAAPEQLRGGAITTATDVYSLGSVLHMLVVDRPPQFADGVADGECRNPASLVGRDGDGTLRRMLSGDLGEILKKALARDPGRRYPGVSELAADLRAWRSGRPVAARRGGSGYRFRRLVMRHKLATGLVVALVASLAAGIVGFAWQAEHARREALASDIARDQADAARQRAERALQRAEAVKSFTIRLFDARAPAMPEAELPSTVELLDAGIERARTPEYGDPGLRAEMLATIAHVFWSRGMQERAEELVEEALALSATVRESDPESYARALLIKGRVGHVGFSAADREQYLRQADDFMQAHDPDSRVVLDVRSEIAYNLMFQNRYDEAVAMQEVVVAAMASRDDVAMKDYRRALGILGGILMSRGQYERAAPHLRKAFRMQDPATSLLNYTIARVNLASNEMYLGKLAQSEREARAAIAAYGTLFDRPVDYVRAARNLLWSCLLRQGRIDEALEVVRKSHPDVVSGQEGGPDYHRQRAKVLAAGGRWEAGLAEARTSRDKAAADEAPRPMQVLNNALLAQLSCRTGRSQDVADGAHLLQDLLAHREGDTVARARYVPDMVEAAAVCAIAAGRDDEALAALRALEPVDARLPLGDVHDVARRQRLQAQLLRTRGDTATADRLERRAKAGLDAGGYLPSGPIRSIDLLPPVIRPSAIRH